MIDVSCDLSMIIYQRLNAVIFSVSINLQITQNIHIPTYEVKSH